MEIIFMFADKIILCIIIGILIISELHSISDIYKNPKKFFKESIKLWACGFAAYIIITKICPPIYMGICNTLGINPIIPPIAAFGLYCIWGIYKELTITPEEASANMQNRIL